MAGAINFVPGAGLKPAAAAAAAAAKKVLPPFPDFDADDNDGGDGDGGASTSASASASAADPVITDTVSCEIISVNYDTVQITAPAGAPPPRGVGSAALPFSALMDGVDLSSLAGAPLSNEAFERDRKQQQTAATGAAGSALLDVIGMPKSTPPAAAAGPTVTAAADAKSNIAAAAASAGAAAASASSDAISLHHYAWKFMSEIAVYAQIIRLKQSLWIWIGGSDARFANLNLALIAASHDTAAGDAAFPPVTSFIGKNVGFSQSLTQRLAVVSRSPVYVSYNLPSHNQMLEAFVQKKLTDALKLLPASSPAAAAAGATPAAAISGASAAAPK